MKHASIEASTQNKPLIHRLSKIEGQIRGVKRMIEEDSYCDDVINQIEAVRSALKSIELLLLKNHIEHCVVQEIQQGDLSGVYASLETMRKLVK